MKITPWICDLVRHTGELPPEPPPDPASIDRKTLTQVVSECRSRDGRLVILVDRADDKLYRGYQFTWNTHADDDLWVALWVPESLGIIADEQEIVMQEAARRLAEYEQRLTKAEGEPDAAGQPPPADVSS